MSLLGLGHATNRLQPSPCPLRLSRGEQAKGLTRRTVSRDLQLVCLMLQRQMGFSTKPGAFFGILRKASAGRTKRKKGIACSKAFRLARGKPTKPALDRGFS